MKLITLIKLVAYKPSSGPVNARCTNSETAKIDCMTWYCMPVLMHWVVFLFLGGWWFGVPGGDLQYCIRIRCVVFWDPAQWAGKAAPGLPDLQHRQGLAQPRRAAQEVPQCVRWLSGERLNMQYYSILSKNFRTLTNLILICFFFSSHLFCRFQEWSLLVVWTHQKMGHTWHLYTKWTAAWAKWSSSQSKCMISPVATAMAAGLWIYHLYFNQNDFIFRHSYTV